MKYCPYCGAQLDDAAVVCTNCGTNLGAPQYAPMAPVVPSYDHTAEFNQIEVSEGKVFGIAIYLLGFMGVIVALLASRDNRFVAFHIRNWLKIEICSIISLVALIIPVLGWIAVGVWAVITFVVSIMCFFDVCKGKAVEPAIIRNFGFLK